jgi:phosphate transport system protein
MDRAGAHRLPIAKPELDRRIAELAGRLAAQGRAVQALIEGSVDAAFDADAAKARSVIEGDHAIDHEDVQIERAAVALLIEASGAGTEVSLDAQNVRMLLTIVKVNNEFERIADCAVNIAERAGDTAALRAAIPPKFRVMANSVIGIMQTTNTAFAQIDRVAAQLVLASDDATDAFTRAVIEDTLSRLMRGELSLPLAQALQAIASNLAAMADHCTNVAEQVIYLSTGQIVRHEGERWGKPEDVA